MTNVVTKIVGAEPEEEEEEEGKGSVCPLSPLCVPLSVVYKGALLFCGFAFLLLRL